MTNKDLETAFYQALKNLKDAKEKKIVEFEETIKDDLNDFIKAGNISQEHCEAYFSNLKDALEEKEQEIDAQIKKETERLVNDYLLKLKDAIKMEILKGNDLNLTDTVLDSSMDYFEVKISEMAKPKKQTPSRISDRLSNIIPTEITQPEVEKNVEETENDDILNEIFGGMESNEKTIDQLVPMIEEEVEEDFTMPTQAEENEIDDAIEELISRVMVPQTEVVEKETVEEVTTPEVEEMPVVTEEQEDKKEEQPAGERVSTVDLEKLLEEVRNLM